jgi:hypothetical protein
VGISGEGHCKSGGFMNKNDFARKCLLAAGLFAAVLLLLTVAFAQQSRSPFQGRMTVINPMGHAVSAPLRDLARQKPKVSPQSPARITDALPLPSPLAAVTDRSGNRTAKTLTGAQTKYASSFAPAASPASLFSDPDLQTKYPSSILPPYGVSVEGIGADGSFSPPDTNLAVGADQVVQVVNVRLAIYDKLGQLKPGYPISITQLFSALSGSICSDVNNTRGHALVVYDQIANRWLISRLGHLPQGDNHWHVCIAVSQSQEADSSYSLYDYDFGLNKPEYPLFSVWPDAYYFSAAAFANGTTFIGAEACAFDRNAMVAGSPSAALVCFQGSTNLVSLLPSNQDGAVPPPAGSPNIFMQASAGKLNLYKFHVDFVTPGLSTFTGPTNISVASFTWPSSTGEVIPQSGIADKLSVWMTNLTDRLSYRNFGSYESLVVNHTVQVSLSSSQTGIRWYEIRNPFGTPTVKQQSTFSPDTPTYRWLGSIAQDKQGNMLLSYTASSSSLFPSLRYTGRIASDPLNQMEREGTIKPGGGSQQQTNPPSPTYWETIPSVVAVDPVDGCTFWLATKYLKTTGPAANWSTQIANVRFPGCN